MAQAVIGVRGGHGAKTRCADTLSGPDRARLTAAMLEDMLAAVTRCPDITATWVVTPTPELAELAAGFGVQVIEQKSPQGLNAAFVEALSVVGEHAPYEPAVLMPGDLPLLEPDDLAAAIHLLRTHEVVLAPSLDGGTGLVGLRAGVRLSPAFGPASFRRHAAIAQRAGLSVALVVATSLSHDVDHPGDLAYLREHGAATRAGAFLLEHPLAAPPGGWG